jgi:[ribosomal protein S5]-alanine N-acetyltransferase
VGRVILLVMDEAPFDSIETERLNLKSMSSHFLNLCFQRDKNGAQSCLNVPIAKEWWIEGPLMELRLAQLAQNPTLAPWLLRAIVRRSDNTMVGHFNGHGRPGMDHLKPYASNGIEIGYTIYEPFRRQGYASEAIMGFAQWAVKKNGPISIVLSIGLNNFASLDLAEKLNFAVVDEVYDGEIIERVFIREFTIDR